MGLLPRMGDSACEMVSTRGVLVFIRASHVGTSVCTYQSQTPGQSGC